LRGGNPEERQRRIGMPGKSESAYNLSTPGKPVRRLPQKGESARYKYFIDKELMQHFGETFDDFTQLHYDDDYARKVGFAGGRPVQGALVSCLIVKSISLTFGDSAILQTHNLEFIEPIYPGNEITVELYVLANTRDKLITMRSRIYVGEDIHYQGETRIKAFNDI
jgi:acyl dehydratase